MCFVNTLTLIKRAAAVLPLERNTKLSRHKTSWMFDRFSAFEMSVKFTSRHGVTPHKHRCENSKFRKKIMCVSFAITGQKELFRHTLRIRKDKKIGNVGIKSHFGGFT